MQAYIHANLAQMLSFLTMSEKTQKNLFRFVSFNVADLANRDTVTNYAFSPLSTIVDGNEDTCLGPFTKEVSLRWTIPYQITWMRVHVQDSCTYFLCTHSLVSVSSSFVLFLR